MAFLSSKETSEDFRELFMMTVDSDCSNDIRRAFLQKSSRKRI